MDVTRGIQIEDSKLRLIMLAVMNRIALEFVDKFRLTSCYVFREGRQGPRWRDGIVSLTRMARNRRAADREEWKDLTCL